MTQMTGEVDEVTTQSIFHTMRGVHRAKKNESALARNIRDTREVLRVEGTDPMSILLLLLMRDTGCSEKNKNKAEDVSQSSWQIEVKSDGSGCQRIQTRTI